MPPSGPQPLSLPCPDSGPCPPAFLPRSPHAGPADPPLHTAGPGLGRATFASRSTHPLHTWAPRLLFSCFPMNPSLSPPGTRPGLRNVCAAMLTPPSKLPGATQSEASHTVPRPETGLASSAENVAPAAIPRAAPRQESFAQPYQTNEKAKYQAGIAARTASVMRNIYAPEGLTSRISRCSGRL